MDKGVGCREETVLLCFGTWKIAVVRPGEVVWVLGYALSADFKGFHKGNKQGETMAVFNSGTLEKPLPKQRMHGFTVTVRSRSLIVYFV